MERTLFVHHLNSPRGQAPTSNLSIPSLFRVWDKNEDGHEEQCTVGGHAKDGGETPDISADGYFGRRQAAGRSTREIGG